MLTKCYIAVGILLASSIQGYDEERFVTTINRNFLCLICFNVLKDPFCVPETNTVFVVVVLRNILKIHENALRVQTN